jgi:preprotein translocase subunit SecG
VQPILLVLHMLVAVALVALVLLQHGRGADVGAAFGSGASGTVFGARGSGSFLTRVTAGLAVAFFVLSLVLGYIAGQSVKRTSVVERVQAPQETPAQDVPRAPVDVPQPPASLPAPAQGPAGQPEQGQAAGGVSAAPASDIPAAPAGAPPQQ